VFLWFLWYYYDGLQDSIGVKSADA